MIIQRYLIADHGNCETMINPDGSPHTAHTTNPVPIILIDKDLNHINRWGFRRSGSNYFKVNWY